MALPKQIRESINRQGTDLLVTGQRFKRFDQVRQRHFWSTYRFTPDQYGYLPSGDFELFQTPSGQAGQGFAKALTLLETNWPGANQVAENQNLEVTELGITATASLTSPNGDAPDFQARWNTFNAGAIQGQLINNTVLSITYLTNTVPLGLCSDFAQAGGPLAGIYAPNLPAQMGQMTQDTVDGSVVLTPPYTLQPMPNATEYTKGMVTNGFAAPGLRRRFDIPLMLQHGETFSLTLQIPPGRQPFILPMLPCTWPEFLEGDIGCHIDVRLDMWATESFVEKS